MKKTILFTLLFFFILTACKKDDDTAPPITQENTFSCKINGELFLPEDYSSFPNTFPGISNLIIPENNWFFHFRNRKRDIYIYIVNVLETGSYTIQLSDGNGDFLGDENSGCEVDLNKPNGTRHHSINNNDIVRILELDIDTRIVLEFDEITLVGNNDPNDIIKLTEGKLNINRETLNQD